MLNRSVLFCVYQNDLANLESNRPNH